MVTINIHTKAGKTVSLTFHGSDAQEANLILVNYADWLAVGQMDVHGGMADPNQDAPMIDRREGMRRVIIHFSQIEYMEAE